MLKRDVGAGAKIPALDGLSDTSALTADRSLTWSSYARSILVVNCYANGITVALHSNHYHTDTNSSSVKHQTDAEADLQQKRSGSSKQYLPCQFHLRLRDTRDYLQPSGRYFLYRDRYSHELERHLQELQQNKQLHSTVAYFGTVADPFHSFQKKFNVTMSCLALFERYRPLKVVVQSRSPMIVAALPLIKGFGDAGVVAIPIESRLDSAISRYTPGQPRIVERLKAADGLRLQGVQVQLIASPLLPYGDQNRHAWDFAELLDQHGDFIAVSPLATGDPAHENTLRELPIARLLVSDNQYRWLRPNCHLPLLRALQIVSPGKLSVPVTPFVEPSQLGLFAA